MAWQPAYKAYGSEPLIRQMMAIIYRDIQDALDWVTGKPGSLPPFNAYHLAEQVMANFPGLSLFPVVQAFDPAQANVAKESISMVCIVVVTAGNANAVAVRVQQYAMAVWHVLTAAQVKTSGDFLTEGLALPPSAYPGSQVSAGMAAGSVKRIFVQQPSFHELARARSLFAKAASLEIEAQLFEA